MKICRSLWGSLLCVSLIAGCSEPPAASPEQAVLAAEPASEVDAAEGEAEQTPVPTDGQVDDPTKLAVGGIDWPSFLGPNRDSKSPETGLLQEWPAEGPPIIWQRELGEGYGIGSTADGRYFQFDRIGNEARLVALAADTGKLLWEFKYSSAYTDLYGYDGGPRASPVIDGERVYIYGVEGMLHCLDAASGDVHWKVDVNREFGVVQNFFGVGSTPVIEQGLLLVMVGGSPPDSQAVAPGALDRVEANGSGIVAFDKMSGAVKYKTIDDLASYSSPIVASMNGKRYGFAFMRDALFAFDPANGQEHFRYDWRATILESVNASTPVIVGDEVFISETYGPGSSLLKVTPEGYDVVWQDDPRARDKNMQTHWNTAIYVDGFLYGSSGRHEYNAELRCIDWSTGKVMWSKAELTRSSLLLADGRLICLSEDGTLRLLNTNPKEYEVISEVVLRKPAAQPQIAGLAPARLLKSPAWAAPVLSHGLLYVRGADRVVCLDLRAK